jgi:hypothetical protein
MALRYYFFSRTLRLARAEDLYPPSAELFDVTYLLTWEEKHGGSVGSVWERP